jgi:hypothetical protein
MTKAASGVAEAIRISIAESRPELVLDAAEKATSNGDFKEALKGFLWYHRHALKYNEAQGGVRLSFALLYWTELCAVYKPAMNAYLEILERSSTRLLEGKGTWDLFHEVVSMNERIDRNADSLELFRHLMSIKPILGDRYVIVMMDLLLDDGDHETCLQFSDPEGTVESELRFLPHFEKVLREFPNLDPTKGVRDVGKKLQQSLEILWANRLYKRAHALQANTSAALDEQCVHDALANARKNLKKRAKQRK